MKRRGCRHRDELSRGISIKSHIIKTKPVFYLVGKQDGPDP